MNFNTISTGKSAPHDINAVIEIPAHSSPVKYEIDKENNIINVDRFIATPMFYPTNYGFIPKTLANDGDPLDILVPTPCPVIHGAVIRCRPIGVLNMTDESGEDAKIIAVPHTKLSTLYDNIKESTDLPELLIQQIEYFFAHYKNLEKDKWVKIESWENSEKACSTIMEAIQSYKP